MAINNNFADNSLVNITESGQTRKGLKVNGQTGDAALDRAMQDNANLAAVDVESMSSRIDELRNTVVDDSDQLLIGGNGDDNIATFAGDDTVHAGHGNDLIVTNAGDDNVHAGNGDDIVDLGDGADKAHGGNGNDIIFGGAGDDEIEGGNGDDVLYGEKGNDHLKGGNGNDYLHGGAGNDILDGGTGDDFLVAGTGSNTLIGGQGNDTAIFEMSSDSFHMDYDDAGNIIITDAFDDNNVTTVSGVENFIFLSKDGEELLTREELVEFIDDMRATQGDDVLTGTDGDDVIDGLAGNDTIDGAAGNDTIDGGTGNDTIDGGAGNDTIDGGEGDDIIDGGTGNDTIDGGTGNDTLDGGEGDDIIDGGAGNDTIDGGEGDDIIDGGTGDDIISGSEGNDTIDGAAGNDTIDGGTGNDTIDGGSGNDIIDGGAGDDIIDGGTGNDTIDGGAGNDIIDGGAGNDTISGGTGDDIISGSDGNDVIDAGAGNDIIDAGAGNNIIDGSDGTDTVGLAGNRGDYAIVDNGNSSFTLTNNDSGDVNTISNVENFEFADQTITSIELSNELAEPDNRIVLVGGHGETWGSDLNKIDPELAGKVSDADKARKSTHGNESWVYGIIDYETGEVLGEISKRDLQDALRADGRATNGIFGDNPNNPLHGMELDVNGETHVIHDSYIHTPIILDIDGDGIELTSTEDGVVFDLDGDGTQERTSWTAGNQGFDDAFLALDRNGDGEINSGKELFGDQNGAANGYEELAKFDSNQDGQITAEDEIYDELKLWADMDADGKVDDGEIRGLAEMGVESISTGYTGSFGDKKDEHGNDISLESSFTLNVNGESVTRNSVDAFFNTEDLSTSEQVSLLGNEIANLESELQNLIADENHDVNEVDSLRSEIENKRTEFINLGG